MRSCWNVTLFSFYVHVSVAFITLAERRRKEATVACDSFFVLELLLFFFFLLLCVCLCLRASRLWDCASCSLIYVRKYSKQHSGTLFLPSVLSLVWELFCELVKRKKNWCTEKKLENFISSRLVPGGATSPKYQALRELFLFNLLSLLLFPIPQLSL